MEETKQLATLLQNDQLPNRLVKNLTLDSREVKTGDLFFAYPGHQQDGRTYLKQAVSQGASAILYESGDGFVCDADEACLFIPVSNLKAKVGPIAARFFEYPSVGLNITGVTGTNGKTSITHFIAQALEKKDIRAAVVGTLGNGLLSQLLKPSHTTPNPIQLQKQLALFRKQGISHVAMEVSSHALDQSRVVGVEFETAVFTQLSRDHLDYHGDLESYAKAKELLFKMPRLKHAVINQDDTFGRVLIERYKRILNLVTTSINPNGERQSPYVVAEKMKLTSAGMHLLVASSWGRGELQTPLLGAFNVSNLLAVLAVLLLNGMPWSDALAVCSQLQPVRGRMQQFGGVFQPRVVVDYAHTPDALEKTLTTLRAHCQGRLWCVFGCGGDRDRGKRPQMGLIATTLADRVVITNDNPRTESPELIAEEIQAGLVAPEKITVILDRAQAIQTVVQSAKINDIVLIAGKGHETTQTIGCDALPFDDTCKVTQALALWQKK